MYKLYKEHEKELIIGVRNNYINIYYNCNSIAKVFYTKKNKIRCAIASYFLPDDFDYQSDEVILNNEEDVQKYIVKRYNEIKKLCESQGKNIDEKIAQQKLFMLNNNNPDSNWFCFDVEWIKAFSSQTVKNSQKYNARFDILAISKESPHKIAFIELKYGKGAIGGKSGIVKHFKDYRAFSDSKHKYFEDFKEEAVSIITSLQLLDIEVPNSLRDLNVTQIDSTPYFYIAALNNENDEVKHQMAKYLFDHKEWGLKTRVSTKNAQETLGINVLNRKSCGINLTFLFSKQTNENLAINNVIEGFEEKITQQ